MTPEQLAIYQKCTGRTTPPISPFTRPGWSSADAAASPSSSPPSRSSWRASLTGGRISVPASRHDHDHRRDRRQARVIKRFCSRPAAAVPMLKRQIEDETQEIITLNNNVVDRNPHGSLQIDPRLHHRRGALLMRSHSGRRRDVDASPTSKLSPRSDRVWRPFRTRSCCAHHHRTRARARCGIPTASISARTATTPGLAGGDPRDERRRAAELTSIDIWPTIRRAPPLNIGAQFSTDLERSFRAKSSRPAPASACTSARRNAVSLLCVLWIPPAAAAAIQ